VNAVVIWLLRFAERRFVIACAHSAVDDRKVLPAKLPNLFFC